MDNSTAAAAAQAIDLKRIGLHLRKSSVDSYFGGATFAVFFAARSDMLQFQTPAVVM